MEPDEQFEAIKARFESGSPLRQNQVAYLIMQLVLFRHELNPLCVVTRLVTQAIRSPQSQHDRWFLERIARELDIEVEHPDGIAP
jgi:hypothetical protein